MVEGYVHVENAAEQTRGTFLDGLHPWNRSQIVPGRGRMGYATVLGPLYGPGISEGGAGEGSCGIGIPQAEAIADKLAAA